MSVKSPEEIAQAERKPLLPFIERFKERLPRFKERLPKSRAVIIVPALVVVGFLVTASFQPNACAVMIDGEEVAIVQDKTIAEGALNGAYARISSEQEVFTDKDISFKKVRAGESELVSPEKLEQIFLAQLDLSVEATAILVDGKAVAWVKDETTAKEVLEKFQAGFSLEGCETLSFEMLNEVTFEDCKVCADKVMDCDAVVNLLKTGTDKVVKYCIKPGDSLWSIARANDTHVKDILQANPGLTENCILALGSEINLTKTEPLIHVEAVYKKAVRGIIEFPTEYVKDTKLASGRTKVKQAGKNGEKEVVYRFRTRDGVKVGQEILSTTVIKEPVTKIVAQGKRAYLASRGGSSSRISADEGGGSGTLRWPTTAKRISQRYRSGHRAIDIDGSTGDPIYAAAGGTVTFAGTSGGYGKCILIKHSNGLTTRYAHLSSISVSSGDKVSSGEVIGRLGSTGRSTGSHLHFEVISGGAQRNPLNYL